MKRILIAAMTAALLFSVPGVFADGSPGSPIITGNNCALRIEFDADAAGTNYTVQLWDDGSLLYERTVTSSSVGQTFVFTYEFPEILEGNPGIGILIYQEEGLAFIADPYTGLDTSCATYLANQAAAPVAGCDTYMNITNNAVVGTFTNSADLYYAPGDIIAPQTTIPVGQSAWVLGVDESSAYYKIIWSCDYLWVPVSTMGPNFDETWGGMPLPATVVD